MSPLGKNLKSIENINIFFLNSERKKPKEKECHEKILMKQREKVDQAFILQEVKIPKALNKRLKARKTRYD